MSRDRKKRPAAERSGSYRDPRESRDANDPRDMMRGMRKQARAEFERTQQGDSGGQEHASRADREGVVDRGPGEPTDA
jgi:hypothetical protein